MKSAILGRRLAAYMIDMILTALIAAVVMATLLLAAGDRVVFSNAFLDDRYCVPIAAVDAGVVARIEAAFGPIPTPVSARLCEQSILGVSNAFWVELNTIAPGVDGRDLAQTYSVATDRDGHLADPTFVDGNYLYLGLLVVGSAGFLAFGRGRTPGKRLLRLRVAARSYGFGQMFMREFLKPLPVLALIGLVLGFSASSNLGVLAVAQAAGAFNPFVTAAGLAAALYVALVVYWWVMPLVFRRGRMHYDALIGGDVVPEAAP
ncbi:MAG: hypothetical protein AAGH83_03730 [Pseudomonadota bacterium]